MLKSLFNLTGGRSTKEQITTTSNCPLCGSTVQNYFDEQNDELFLSYQECQNPECER